MHAAEYAAGARPRLAYHRAMRCAAIAILAACHAQPAPVQSTSPSADATCRDAIEQFVAHLEEIATSAGHETTSDEHAQLRVFRDAVAKRCTEDAWSADAIRCFRDAVTERALTACVDTLTHAQKAKLDEVELPARRPLDDSTRAKHAVQKYAFEAYPAWATQHPDQACPATLAELAPYTDVKQVDPWGHPYKVMCGASLPPDVRGLAAASAGPDGVFDTADDIHSW